jgi:hypothetical protein
VFGVNKTGQHSSRVNNAQQLTITRNNNHHIQS